MVSQRGVLNLFHSDGTRNAMARRGNAMRLSGIDAELLDRDQVRAFCPLIDTGNARFPVMGGLLQRRGGSVRHDAVAWGYARAADSRGVDIIQHCEVTGINMEGGQVTGVRTTRGNIRARKIGLAVAGNTSRLAQMAGLDVPIESHVLQAFVSEGIKPLVHSVITFGAGHFYISQSDKGGLVFGGGLDGWNSYAQRGNLPVLEDVWTAGIAMMPVSVAPARLAQLGRRDGHDVRRFADHLPHADRRADHDRRLVLWRVQGDAGLRLVPRLDDRQGRTAQTECRVHAGAVP